MKAFSQSGHAMSTTMVIVAVLALISLTALRNGLMDFKIAQAFDQQQLFSERHYSALYYFESVIVPQIMNTESTLYRSLESAEDDVGMGIGIPLGSLLEIDSTNEAEGYLDPVVLAYRQQMPGGLDAGEAGTEVAPVLRLRFEIRDNNTGHAFTAMYQYDPDPDTAALFDPARIHRLSLYKSAS